MSKSTETKVAPKISADPDSLASKAKLLGKDDIESA